MKLIFNIRFLFLLSLYICTLILFRNIHVKAVLESIINIIIDIDAKNKNQPVEVLAVINSVNSIVEIDTQIQNNILIINENQALINNTNNNINSDDIVIITVVNDNNNNNISNIHAGEVSFRNNILDSITIDNILEAMNKFEVESKSQFAIVINRILKKLPVMGVTLPENFPTGSYGMMNKKNKDIWDNDKIKTMIKK